MTSEQITDWRHSLGLTQTEAAARLGVSMRMYQYYEAGSYKIPLRVKEQCILMRGLSATL